MRLGWLNAIGLAIALGLFPSAAFSAAGTCGEETPCTVSSGTYYIHLPENREPSKPLGAILYLHGHRGKAVNAMKNKNFKRMADKFGVAFVAVQGVNGTWSFPTAPRKLRNEPAFFDDVLADLTKRFGVDRKKTLLTGFSSGGFMTWYLACEQSDRFSGYAPIAGAFWEPLPQNCPTEPPYLFHVHGTSDKVVPLEGRWLGEGRWKQGDVFKSFGIWRRQSGLAETAPETLTDGALSCKRWRPETGFLELCLHKGGHSVRAEWIERAWKLLAEMKGWES
jgi:polyhydroxybutyrate depolymerase